MIMKTTIIFFAMTVIFTRVKWYWGLPGAFLFLLTAGIAELVSSWLITFFWRIEFSSVVSFTPYRYYANLLTNFILFIFIKIVSRVRKANIDKTPIQWWCLLMLLPVFSFLITMQVILSQLYADTPHTLLSAISLFGLFYANIIVFLIFDGVSQYHENRHMLLTLETQLSLQKSHNASIIENQFRIQQMSHDFKQHTHGFLRLCKAGQTGELTEALQALLDQ